MASGLLCMPGTRRVNRPTLGPRPEAPARSFPLTTPPQQAAGHAPSGLTFGRGMLLRKMVIISDWTKHVVV
jgi:hypothetical protein